MKAKNEEYPDVGSFLSLLENDMVETPANISELDVSTLEKARSLTEGITVNDKELN